MRYLKPGKPIEINGKIYNVRFSLDMIDEIQDKAKMSISEVMMLLYSKKHKKIAIELLLKTITGQEIKVSDDEIDYYSIMLISAYIDQIKYKDMPEPNESSGEEETIPFVDVEYWFYIGKVVLGFPADEVWQMTIGQIRTLLQEHYKFHGLIKEDKVYNIDDVIPY